MSETAFATLTSMGFTPELATDAISICGDNVVDCIEYLTDCSLPVTMTNGSSVENNNSSYQITQLEISQYTFSDSGSSACTAIALIVLCQLMIDLQSKQFGIPSVQKLTNLILEGVGKYNELSNGVNRHFSVDEMVSLVPNTIKMISNYPMNGLTTAPNAFHNLFAEVRLKTEDEKYIGLVITKPPETICVILPPKSSINLFYYLFDSHSRHQLGLDGAYLITSKAEVDIVNHLQKLFNPFLFDDHTNIHDVSMSESLYNMYEGTIFQNI